MPFNRRQFILRSGVFSGLTGLHLSSFATDTPPQNSDRLVLLGTQGGPFIRSYKQTPAANLIVYKNIPIVIDAGFGVTFKLLDAGVSLSAIKYIFITHNHSDHNLELGPLLYNAWVGGLKETVNVYGPTGINSLLSSYWESNRLDIDTRINDEGRPDIRKLVIGHEYTQGDIVSDPDFVATALKNVHPPISESYSLKFKLGNNKIIVFSGDTAPFSEFIAFSSKADYLIHEVMYIPAVEEMVKRRPNATKLKASILSHHTSTEQVGKIASAANVQTLVLTHFVPADDKSLTEKVWLDAVKATFNGEIVVGKDLLQLML